MQPITRLLLASTLLIAVSASAAAPVASPTGASTPPMPAPPELTPARKALAAGDLVSARIALNTLLEETRRNPELARAARRMLEVDLPLTQAEQRLAGKETFLLEESLKAVERKLKRPPQDADIRERMATIRQQIALVKETLERERPSLSYAVRYQLNLYRLENGNFPLTREEADSALTPALARGAKDFSLISWTPTPGGYRLLLQDKRSGESFEITPE